MIPRSRFLPSTRRAQNHEPTTRASLEVSGCEVAHPKRFHRGIGAVACGSDGTGRPQPCQPANHTLKDFCGAPATMTRYVTGRLGGGDNPRSSHEPRSPQHRWAHQAGLDEDGA